MLRKGDAADRIYPDERSRLMRGAGGWGEEKHQASVVKDEQQKKRRKNKTLLKLS